MKSPTSAARPTRDTADAFARHRQQIRPIFFTTCNLHMFVWPICMPEDRTTTLEARCTHRPSTTPNLLEMSPRLPRIDNFVSIARMPLCMGRAKPNPELESMAIEAHLRSAVACVRSDSCACADLDEVQSRQSRLLPGAPQDCTHSLGPATTARKGGLASEAILPHDMQATMTIKTKMLPGLLTCRMATCTCRKCPQQDQCKRLRNPSEQRLAECPDPSSFLDFLNDRLRTLMLTRQCQIAAS